MKLTLIYPNYAPHTPQAPINLLQLAAIAERAGWDVEVIDCNVLDISAEEAVHKITGDVVGLTGMTPHISFSLHLAKLIKENTPDKPIILGGPHMTVLPKDTMKNAPQIDIGCIGEGEITLTEVLDHYENGRPLNQILSIAYREGDKIIVNPRRPHIKNLDTLPLPAYHLLENPLTQYKPYAPHDANHFMIMVTSRGCPYNCTFCGHSVWQKDWNAFSAEYIAAHIEHLMGEYGVRYIQFYDDTFTFDRMRIIRLCELIRPLKIRWSCETRVDRLDRELLETMKGAGLVLIGFGVESGVQRVINSLKKGITLGQVRDVVSWCDELDIESVGYMMMGSPGETREDIMESIRFVGSLPFDFIQYSITTPYLGTELYEIAKRNGVAMPDDWDKWVYVNLGSVKEKPSITANEFMGPEELTKLAVLGYKRFYLRPSYILRRLRKCLNWRGLKMNINGVKMLIEAIR